MSFHVTAGKLKLERLLLFTDAVFAIIMTLLALDLRVPAEVPLRSRDDVLQALANVVPGIGAYVISFAVIAMMWSAHLRRYRYLTGANDRLVGGTMLQLVITGLIPFATSMLSRSVDAVVVILYSAIILVNVVAASATWNLAVRDPALVDAHFTAAVRRRENLRSAVVAGNFLLSIGLAFWSPVLAMWSWTLQLPLNRLLNRSHGRGA
jgi:uncharacterized membrane protein